MGRVELGGVVGGQVEANDGARPELGEDVGVVRRRKVAAAVGAVEVAAAGGERDGAPHGEQLARDDLVEVGVERAVELLVLVRVEAAGAEVHQALLAGARQAGPAVAEVEVEVLLAGGDVAEGGEQAAPR